MKAARSTVALFAVGVAIGLAGCSSGSGLTTGSLFGSEDKPAAPAQTNDPTMRAFQVGTVSARAIKCGFNFDPAKLKASYLAYERGLAGATADLGKIERTYDASFNGVAKAVAGEADYCTATKTKTIKADLNRHLTGDYTPSALPEEPKEEGLFSGWGSGGDSEGKGYTAKHPMDNSDI
jgi:hypothetical protein